MYEYLNDRVDINIILPHISKFTYNHELDNVSFNLCSLRLNTFKFKGLDCVCCGRKGTHFRIQRTKNSNENYHIGLWSDDGIQMTKDHIIPKSFGGVDNLNNMQTMCDRCNSKKSNKISIYDILKGEFKENYEVIFN